jgi:DNA-binding MarR family transcriptional regulator
MTTATAQYACARAWVALAQAHAVVTERLRAELSIRCRLSVNGFEALVRLADGGRDGVRMRELNRSIRLSQPALSRLVARLEQQRLVRREGDPTDRRGVRLALTALGQERLHEAAEIHAECVRQVLASRLTDAEADLLADARGQITD